MSRASVPGARRVRDLVDWTRQVAGRCAADEGLDNAVKRTPENSTPTSFRLWSEEVLKPAVLKQAEAVTTS
jgi:hypothetical protein